MKKIIVVLCILLLMLSSVLVGVTYASLASKTPSVVNTFVVGNVSLSLTESTGSNYLLIPGTTVKKDPRVMVGKNSEKCWLFFKIESDEELEKLVTYSIADGWTALEGVEGVYWRQVEETPEDKYYSIIKDDKITVKDTVTEEQLAVFGNDPKMIFYAYAIQFEGISAPETAWENLQTEEDEA